MVSRGGSMAGEPWVGPEITDPGEILDLRRRAKIVHGTLAVSAFSASAFCALVLGSAAAVAQQVQLEPSVSVRETYSDNVDREVRSRREDAFITDVSPSVTLRWNGNRVTTAVDAAATFRHQNAGDDKGLSVLPNAAGLGSAELWQDHLFFDASAAASTVLLNTQENDTDSNRSTVQTYSASPRLLGSFSNFADVETFYRFTQVIEDGGSDAENSDVGNTSTHAIGGTLSSGPDFTRMRWAVNASASEQERDNDANVSRRNVGLDLEYIVDRSFSALGGVGYEFFDDGDPENDISGISWDVGFRWRPGSRTDITATYGRSDDDQSFNLDARHQLSPQTSIFARYEETLETGDERLTTDLSFLGTDPNTGELIDTRTGQPFDPSTNITTTDADTQRTRTFTAGINGTRGRNTFGLSGQVEFTRDVGSSASNDEEDAYEVGVSWGRRLTPRASLNTSFDYSRNEFKNSSRTDNQYEAGFVYSYNIFRNFNAFGSYDFGVQTSDDKLEEFLENRVSVGLSVRF